MPAHSHTAPPAQIMKKTFSLIHTKKTTPRLVESIKHEIRKYIKRERRKSLPDGVDYWGFDCRFGSDETNSVVIHVSEINKQIAEVESKPLDSFYIEILAKPGYRTKKPATKTDSG